jgi:hypothetical protein
MTVTDIRPAESTVTLESQDPVKLEAMLHEPALVGFDTEIREALAALRAKNASEAS